MVLKSFFLRPKSLSTSTSSSESVILHALNFFKKRKIFFDYVIMLQPTSPFTNYKDIEKAIKKLDKNRKIADSIVGYCKCNSVHPLFCATIKKNGTMKPYTKKSFEQTGTLQRQKTKEVYFEEGSLYISDVASFYKNKNFYSARTLPYIVSKIKSIEIDDKIDYIVAKSLLKQRID